MFSKSNASEPSVPLISRRIAFLRPSANRVASNTPMAPPAKRALKMTASSTVTVPRRPSCPTSAWPPRPTSSPPSGRSCTNVSMREDTPVIGSPVIHCAASMMWAPMSPSAPEPDFDLSSRHVIGAFASLSQSCRYCART